jgi:hypothetical protein
MTIPKKGLSNKAQELISKLRREQHFDEGGATEAEPDQEEQDIQAMPGAVPGGANAEPPVQANDVIPPTVTAEDERTPTSTPTEAEIMSDYQNAADQPAPAALPQSAASKQADTNPLNAPANQELGTLNKSLGQLQAAGNAQAAAYKQGLTQLAAIPSPLDLTKKAEDADNKYRDAVAAGKIDPNRFWNNKSIPSKISASLGLILSGIGSGILHQPNLALQVLNKQIDDDIESQKTDLSKNMNLWKMHREKTGSDIQASLLAKNNLLTSVELQSKQAQAQAINPQAALNLAGVIKGIEEQKLSNNRLKGLMDFNKNTKPGQTSNLDPSLLVAQYVPPALQAKAFQEIADSQNIVKNGKSMMKSFDEAAKGQTVLRTGAGYLRTDPNVLALQQSMLPLFDKIDGTVRQAAMDATFHDVIPAAGDSDSTIAVKRKALQNWMLSQTSHPVNAGHNILLNKYTSTNPSPESFLSDSQKANFDYAKAHPQDPRSAKVLKNLGVQ